MSARATAVRRIFVLDGGYSKYLAQLIRSIFRLRIDCSADNGRQQDILPNSQTIQQQEVLKHKTQFLISYLGQGILIQLGQFHVA